MIGYNIDSSWLVIEQNFSIEKIRTRLKEIISGTDFTQPPAKRKPLSFCTQNSNL